jgi:Ca-activated chloride channel homolog
MFSAICCMLLVALSFPFSFALSSYSTAENVTTTRSFDQPIHTLVVENNFGPTDITTWTERTVRVTASRAVDVQFPRIDSEVQFDQQGDNLKIVAAPQSTLRPIALAIHIPSSVQVSVKGGQSRVTIKGNTASLSIETTTGNVAISLPEKSNAEISLRSIRGAIDSRLPVALFGQRDAHVLDGKLGTGGSPIIARSQRGNITIQRESGSWDPSEPGQVQTEPASSSIEGEQKTSPSANTNGTVAVDESPSDVIKLEARLVNLNVKVSDAQGKTLPVLKKEDFVVLEDGVRQEVSYFEPVTAPLNIVLLLDLSGSTEKKIKVIKNAAQRFVDSLKASDRIAVAAFERRFFVLSNFTTDHKLLKDRIGEIKNRHSGTAYYDAMWSTLDLLDEAKATRKAVVVLTDGVDNSLDHPEDAEYDPKHGFDELLARVVEADATIYPLYLDTEYETIGARGRSGHDAYVIARKQLKALADQTGAVMFKAERAEDLEGVYQQIAAELHSLYSMAYTPKVVRRDGKWRKISIDVELPGAKVRTKRGYYAK